ncbi:MAG TPA: GNAT family N-acetyltransferase [Rhodothermales bacterium]|nr:GNAT family N-acetyltransferase [Rhodothermales bacterium]
MSPDAIAAGIDAVEEITSLDELAGLEGEWWDLWEASGATPFQSPAWVLAWWRRFGWNPLCSLALRSEASLVGLAPLFIWPREDTGERTVLLIGTGITDHLDMICAAGFEDEGAERVLDWLDGAGDRWDVCDFQQLHATSPLRVSMLSRQWREETGEQDVCPVLAIPEGVRDGSDFLPRRLWKNAGYYRRRLERLGAVEIEAVTEENFAELFEALVRLHGARWASKGEAGMLAEGDVEAFHRDVAGGMLAHGLLRMYAFRLDGRIVAVYYGMSAKRRAYYYLGGFDPALEKFSPGTQIVAHALCEAAREGCTAFDFLRGREAYKHAWGAADRPTFRRIVRRVARTEIENDAGRARSQGIRAVYGAG